MKYIWVGVGGFAGAISRFWIGSYVGTRLGTKFPYGTFLVNVSGCFVIGLAMTLLDRQVRWGPEWRYLLPIGFIGAYTTFSTFEYETLRSIQGGQFAAAVVNVVASVVFGFAAVWLGTVLGRAVV